MRDASAWPATGEAWRQGRVPGGKACGLGRIARDAGVGRRPNTEDLGLFEGCRVARGRPRIIGSTTVQTTNVRESGALGDCNARGFTHRRYNDIEISSARQSARLRGPARSPIRIPPTRLLYRPALGRAGLKNRTPGARVTRCGRQASDAPPWARAVEKGETAAA